MTKGVGGISGPSGTPHTVRGPPTATTDLGGAIGSLLNKIGQGGDVGQRALKALERMRLKQFGRVTLPGNRAFAELPKMDSAEAVFLVRALLAPGEFFVCREREGNSLVVVQKKKDVVVQKKDTEILNLRYKAGDEADTFQFGQEQLSLRAILVHFVTEGYKEFRLEVEGLKDCLHPALSRDQAQHLLQDRPSGSFLIRDSSRPGCLAITLKQKEGSFQHRLLKPQAGAEGIFLLDEKTPVTFHDILQKFGYENLIRPKEPKPVGTGYSAFMGAADKAHTTAHKMI